MKRIVLSFFVVICLSFMGTFFVENGRAATSIMKDVSSAQDFATVRAKALAFIQSKNLTVFAEFDHGKNAQDVQLALPPTTVIVFGSPLVGTKLMQAFPGIGMELPLKILIAQTKDGKTVLSYPLLEKRFAAYGVPKNHAIVQKIQGLLEALARSATQ